MDDLPDDFFENEIEIFNDSSDSHLIKNEEVKNKMREEDPLTYYNTSEGREEMYLRIRNERLGL